MNLTPFFCPPYPQCGLGMLRVPCMQGNEMKVNLILSTHFPLQKMRQA